MSWTYKTASGVLSGPKLRAVGYSGFAEGKNNPAMEKVHRVGPIPRGRWLIGYPRIDSEMGKDVLDLIPEFGTETHGRSCFAIHGENPDHPGESSRGCIILPHDVREAIWKSGDHHLVVT